MNAEKSLKKNDFLIIATEASKEISLKSYEYFIQTEKKHIDFINKIMEAYEGLGIIRTLDANKGLVKIITIDTAKKDIDGIIEDLNKRDIKIEILEEGFWKGEL